MLTRQHALSTTITNKPDSLLTVTYIKMPVVPTKDSQPSAVVLTSPDPLPLSYDDTPLPTITTQKPSTHAATKATGSKNSASVRSKATSPSKKVRPLTQHKRHQTMSQMTSSKPRLKYPLQQCYPTISKQRGEEGRSVIGLQIDPQGKVHNPHIVRSSGYPRLDQCALRAIKTAQFVPTHTKGLQSTTWDIRFQLKPP